MSDAWNEMGKAKENAYFEKKNSEALARLAKKQQEGKPRLSPITSKPMEQVVVNGIVIDRCTESGGVWLDAGELEQIIDASMQDSSEQEGTVTKMFREILGIKK